VDVETPGDESGNV